MGHVSTERLEQMLEVYKERLDAKKQNPVDYVECFRLSIQIGMLEHLRAISLHEKSEENEEEHASDN